MSSFKVILIILVMKKKSSFQAKLAQSIRKKNNEQDS